MAVRAAPETARKPDRRSEADECRIELAAHQHEELLVIRRIADDSWRVLRLIEGGQLVEAHSVVGGMVTVVNRRLRQYGLGGGAA